MAERAGEEEESEAERRNRQLDQLLQETRVVMPGVQVLFAFLLAVAFQQRFADVSALEKDLYLATILCTAAATICFIAPAAWHRILFQQRDKRHLIVVSNRFVLAGVAFLALAMVVALALVCHVVFGGTMAVIVAAVVAVPFVWFWFAAPSRRRRSEGIETSTS